jgi:outer membrane lipopolysaccharide assembly protein LptE/RlpB
MRRKHGCNPPHRKDPMRTRVGFVRVAAGGSPARSQETGTQFSGPKGSSTCALLTLTLILLFATACGYHTAGHAVTLPADVQTIAIPAFVNRTQTYKIEQRLTAAVVQEMVTRTHYHILNEPSDSADATLRGIVISTSTSPLTYDSQTGRASSALVVVTAKVTLTDRQGKVLYENPSYLFREEYQVSQELSSFFEEDSPALERLSHEFARTLVSNVLEGF